MNKVKIVQCLCPQRHCILGFASDDHTDAELCETLKLELDKCIASQQYNPHCGVCGAKKETWIFEVGVTKFNSMDEAMPYLKVQQFQQILSKTIMDELGLTYDSKNKKPRP